MNAKEKEIGHNFGFGQSEQKLLTITNARMKFPISGKLDLKFRTISSNFKIFPDHVIWYACLVCTKALLDSPLEKKKDKYVAVEM